MEEVEIHSKVSGYIGRRSRTAAIAHADGKAELLITLD